jgi:peptidyl-tRNA hydrolase
MMKLYVLVRKDLSKSQQAVQAGHAVAEWLLHSPDSSDWKNGTLVYLSVENEEDLEYMVQKLVKKGENVTAFREPDIGDRMTALACLAKKPSLFSNFNLVRL